MSDADLVGSKVLDKVWITSKTRMKAEERFKRYSVISHLILSYYALLMILLTIFSNPQAGLLRQSQLSLALSIAIFSASLVIYGFRFGETAQLHRECYLRLQRLLDSTDADEKLVAAYHEIIAGYPNHSAGDYEALVVERTFPGGGSLNNSHGEITWTYKLVLWHCARHAAFWVSVLALALGPFVLLFYSHLWSA